MKAAFPKPPFPLAPRSNPFPPAADPGPSCAVRFSDMLLRELCNRDLPMSEKTDRKTRKLGRKPAFSETLSDCFSRDCVGSGMLGFYRCCYALPPTPLWIQEPGLEAKGGFDLKA